MPVSFVVPGLGNRARFLPPCVVEQEQPVLAELLHDRLLRQGAYAREVEDAAPLESSCDAGADSPDVGDGAVEPNLALPRVIVEHADAVGGVLGAHVERHLRHEEVRADARRGGDAGALEGHIHKRPCERFRAQAVEPQVRGGVDKRLVDRVYVHVVGGNVALIGAYNVGGHLHVAAHARHGTGELDAVGDVAEAAAVLHALCLQGGRDGKTDGVGAAGGVGYHEVCGEGVKPAVGAFDRCVERLQVDAQVSLAAVVRAAVQGASFNLHSLFAVKFRTHVR